jgi:hypothetical protein
MKWILTTLLSYQKVPAYQALKLQFDEIKSFFQHTKLIQALQNISISANILFPAQDLKQFQQIFRPRQ